MRNKELQKMLALLPDDFDICFDEGDGYLVSVTYVEVFKGDPFRFVLVSCKI
jgi:hypothetical protein